MIAIFADVAVLACHVFSSGNVFNSSGMEYTATPPSKAKERVPFFIFLFLFKIGDQATLFTISLRNLHPLLLEKGSVLLDTLPV